MAYLMFDYDDDHDGGVLVEVTPQEIQPTPGVVKAGISDRLQGNLSKAQETLQSALANIIDGSAGGLVRAVRRMADPPDRLEVQFAIKATGELGNLAIGKLGGEANYSVTMAWSKPPA